MSWEPQATQKSYHSVYCEVVTQQELPLSLSLLFPVSLHLSFPSLLSWSLPPFPRSLSLPLFRSLTRPTTSVTTWVWLLGLTHPISNILNVHLQDLTGGNNWKLHFSNNSVPPSMKQREAADWSCCLRCNRVVHHRVRYYCCFCTAGSQIPKDWFHLQLRVAALWSSWLNLKMEDIISRLDESFTIHEMDPHRLEQPLFCSVPIVWTDTARRLR